LSPASFIYQV